MSKKIKVTINPIGIPTLEGIGFAGAECNDKMKPLEDAFGGPYSREDKPEMQEIVQDTPDEQSLSL